ncbi:hypothetical protein FHG87_005916, partial [Trinorchestia longiramus]
DSQGQSVAVQSIFSKALPRQDAPPLPGGGEVQVRVRFCAPLPHSELHGDHADHGDHEPST